MAKYELNLFGSNCIHEYIFNSLINFFQISTNFIFFQTISLNINYSKNLNFLFIIMGT